MEMTGSYTRQSTPPTWRGRTRTCKSIAISAANYANQTHLGSLKWKPPTENSIDFKLVLRFPSTPKKPKEPDYYCKPIFELHVWCGGKQPLAKYEFYDVMYVSDEEWEE